MFTTYPFVFGVVFSRFKPSVLPKRDMCLFPFWGIRYRCVVSKQICCEQILTKWPPMRPFYIKREPCPQADINKTGVTCLRKGEQELGGLR